LSCECVSSDLPVVRVAVSGPGHLNRYWTYAGLNVAHRQMTATDNALPTVPVFGILIILKKNPQFSFNRCFDALLAEPERITSVK
jgi:hypothetical protein